MRWTNFGRYFDFPAIYQMDRHAQEIEVSALISVLLCRFGPVRVLLTHECVAKVHMKDGLVRGCVAQCAFIECPIRMVVKMRVGGDGEGKGLSVLSAAEAGSSKEKECH